MSIQRSPPQRGHHTGPSPWYATGPVSCSARMAGTVSPTPPPRQTQTVGSGHDEGPPTHCVDGPSPAVPSVCDRSGPPPRVGPEGSAEGQRELRPVAGGRVVAGP